MDYKEEFPDLDLEEFQGLKFKVTLLDLQLWLAQLQKYREVYRLEQEQRLPFRVVVGLLQARWSTQDACPLTMSIVPAIASRRESSLSLGLGFYIRTQQTPPKHIIVVIVRRVMVLYLMGWRWSSSGQRLSGGISNELDAFWSKAFQATTDSVISLNQTPVMFWLSMQTH